MPTSVETQLPLAISIACYFGVFLLLVITLTLFLINNKLTILASKLSRSRHSSTHSETKHAETEEEPQTAEVEPGTPFEEFLIEDPQRRALSKKEQFKAYRKWRKDKGLNWATKD